MRRVLAVSMMMGMTLGLMAISAEAAPPQSLYPELSKKKEVRVFLVPFTDISASKKVDLKDLEVKLAEALQARKSIRFVPVADSSQADILIQAEVKDFYWSDHDPVDMLAGVGMAAMDAAVVEHYAHMNANFTVQDAKTKKMLWKDTVIATLTNKTMTEAESLPLINEDMAKVFVRQCFAKKRA